MSGNAMQLQRLEGGTIVSKGVVTFDEVILIDGSNLTYNELDGTITITKKGLYYVD